MKPNSCVGYTPRPKVFVYEVRAKIDSDTGVFRINTAVVAESLGEAQMNASKLIVSMLNCPENAILSLGVKLKK